MSRLKADDPVVSTEILTIALTVLAVWLALRYVGIDIGDLRMAHKQSQKDKEVHNMRKKENEAQKGKEVRKEKEVTAEAPKRRSKVIDVEKQ